MKKTLTAVKVKNGISVEEIKRFSVDNYTDLVIYCRQNGLEIKKDFCVKDKNIVKYYAE